MYYEEAKVKEYYRKNKEGVKTPYYQINLPKKSKFSKVKPIGLVDIAELEKLESFLEANPITEKEAEINELKVEHNEVKQQLQEAKATIESLTSEVQSLTEEKIQLQEDLLTEKNKNESLIETTNSKIENANSNVIEAKNRIEELQKKQNEELKEQKEELKELNSEIQSEKDFSKKLLAVINNKDNLIAEKDKDIVYLVERGLGSRIRNKLTDRIKELVEAKANEVETESSEE